jgi:hypothetical protein
MLVKQYCVFGDLADISGRVRISPSSVGTGDLKSLEKYHHSNDSCKDSLSFSILLPHNGVVTSG